MGEVTSIGAAMIARNADAAMARLTARNDDLETLLGRATRLARQCARRGEIGLLAPDDFADSGRVVVPSALLSDLLAVAAARAVKR